MGEEKMIKILKKFEDLSNQINNKLGRLGDLFEEIHISNYSMNNEMSQNKDQMTLKLTTVWKCDKIEMQLWWELKYESQFQVLSTRTFFVQNGLIQRVQGKYAKSFALRFFQKYTEFLISKKEHFQFVMDVESGQIQLQNKLLHNLEEFEKIIETNQFQTQIIFSIKFMSTIMIDSYSVFQYFEGYSFNFPEFKILDHQNIQFHRQPLHIIHTLQSVMNDIDPNCQQNFDVFSDIDANIKFVIQNDFPLPIDFVNFINVYIGRQKNIELEQSKISLYQMAKIVCNTYDNSLKSEQSEQEDMFLGRKISILTDSYNANWKIIARGGFGVIEKAFVRYQLTNFTNFNRIQNRNQIYEDYLIRKSDTKMDRKIEHEHQIFELLKNQYHENIKAHYIPVDRSEPSYIYSKYEKNMSMDKYISHNKKTASLLTVITLCQQIAKGLLFLKQNKIVHLDIKPNNVLVSKFLKAKISDFGEAFYMKGNENYHKHAFTIPYSPPEIFVKNSGYLNEKIDVYAIGVTLFKVIFGVHIWGDIRDRQQFLSNLISDSQNLSIIPEIITRLGIPQILLPIVKLILKCLSRKQQDRPNLFYISSYLTLCSNYLLQMNEKTLPFAYHQS